MSSLVKNIDEECNFAVRETENMGGILMDYCTKGKTNCGTCDIPDEIRYEK